MIKRTAIAALLSATVFTGFAAHATFTGTAKWSHYFDRKSGNVVVIKTACLTGEDSAAHLKLRSFSDHIPGKPAAHVVYGCYKKGY